jgi:hypothetical protein
MKILKMLSSAAVVLVIVGSALAFKANSFTLGNVWCFHFNPNPDMSCAGQSGGTQLRVVTVTSSGSTANPCASGMSPFISSADACTTPLMGQEYAPNPE